MIFNLPYKVPLMSPIFLKPSSPSLRLIHLATFVLSPRVMAPNLIPDTEPVRQHLVYKIGITAAAPKFVVGSNSAASSSSC